MTGVALATVFVNERNSEFGPDFEIVGRIDETPAGAVRLNQRWMGVWLFLDFGSGILAGFAAEMHGHVIVWIEYSRSRSFTAS